MIRPTLGFALIALVCGAAWSQETQPTVESAQPSAAAAAPAHDGASNEPPEAAEIRQWLATYLESFNKHDAATLASHWTADGASVNQETGEQIVGRDALQTEFAAFFEENPSARLSGRVESLRMIRSDVAAAEGVATMFVDDEPTESAFSAIFVKDNGKWLISSSHERDLPSPATPYDALKDLEWLVGAWQDRSSDALVVTTVRWSPSQAFLIRSFEVQTSDGESLMGTQVIGWDPRLKQIRTWTFNSDGSFGEGIAAKLGDDWTLRMSQTLGDGRLSAATQVITRVDDDTITVQTLGQTVDGEPAPASDSVTVDRIADADALSGVDASEQEGVQP